MVRRLAAASLTLLALVLSSAPPALAAAPDEVQVAVVSYRAWLVNGLSDTVSVAGEIRNTSAYRISGFVTVGLSITRPSHTEAETWSDSVLVRNLAPGQKSPFLLKRVYSTDITSIKVTFITAGGYTNGPTPEGALGVSQVGAPHADGTGGGHILVEARNGNSFPVIVDEIVTTIYAETGKVITGGKLVVGEELAPGAKFERWVPTPEPSTFASAAVSVNAHRTGGNLFRVVAWTNWFHDVGGSKFQRDIAWLAEARVTSGCGSFRFCPSGTVSRGQMASFLAKALKLPAATKDYFTDDETSAHEANINRIAAARITSGCGGTRYCPSDVVTRAQMASFLAKAFDLPSTTKDYFTDDETSAHEANINRIAAARITSGCGGTRYCPSASVTREQMAAFLRRALTR